MDNLVKVSQPATFFFPLKKIFYRSDLIYSFRVFLSFLVATFVPWYFHRINLIVPLCLGILAAVTSDIDDNAMGRIRNLIITSICFSYSSFSVGLLLPYFWPFLIFLVISTFIFTILGAIGPRFTVLGYGSVVIITYAMMGYNTAAPIWQLPFYLILGALLYNGVSFIESILLPSRSSENTIASCFHELSNYLNSKSMLFDPDEQQGFKQQILTLDQNNRNLIHILNQTKIMLFNRLGGIRNSLHFHKLVHYFFVIQFIHEQASASHVQYAKLTAHFKHSDLLFRIARILSQQAMACINLGNSICLHQPYLHNTHFFSDFIFLREAIEQIKSKNKEEEFLVYSLWDLFTNLQAIDGILANSNNDNPTLIHSTQHDLASLGKISLQEKLNIIKRQFTLHSESFRHAARISVVLGLSYIVSDLSQLLHGYWIIMTSLIVCKPTAAATKDIFKLRIFGTLLGAIVGPPIVYLIPNIEAQLFLTALSGCIFFSIKNTRFGSATFFVTLIMFFSFNLMGEKAIIIAPYRIIATIIGCALAYLGVMFLWPDWKYNNLSKQINKLCVADSDYINLVRKQLLTKDVNNIVYALARNDAYEADNTLFTTLNTIITGVRNARVFDNGFRFLMLNRSLLGFISSLGAHRHDKLLDKTLNLFDSCTLYIITALNQVEPISETDILPLKEQLNNLVDSMSQQDEKANFLIIQQLQLILDLLPEFLTLANHLLGKKDPYTRLVLPH